MSEKSSQPKGPVNEKKFTCIMCPLGCAVTVKSDSSGNILQIIGSRCVKGENYIRDEFSAPMRVLTSTVSVEGAELQRLPVRTSGFVAKDMLMACMKEIRKIKVKPPVKIGEVILKNIHGLNVDVIATRDLG